MAKRRRELDAAHCPGTAAVRALRDAAVAFEPHLYAYVPHGGTAQSAQALWASVDLSQGQLELRSWWYEQVDDAAFGQRFAQVLNGDTTP